METKTLTKSSKLLKAKAMFHARWGLLLKIKEMKNDGAIVEWFGGGERMVSMHMIMSECTLLTNEREVIKAFVENEYKSTLNFSWFTPDSRCYEMMEDIYNKLRPNYSVNYIDVYQVIRNLFKKPTMPWRLRNEE